MKRTLLFLVAVAAAASVSGQRTPFQVQQALSDAVVRERQAIARYDAYAARADSDGYAGAASLFRAAAKSEAVHLRRFTELMTARGVTPPVEQASAVHPGTTRQNLAQACEAEQSERDGAYRDAINACMTNRDDEAAKVFDQTRDAEVEHLNLCAAAGRDLEAMRQARQYVVCDHCGYVSEIRLGFCPICRSATR
ncbi:MAG TPA: ferritin family protein [Thermoanaerobaculia bacterium]|nr:ferritin family protein [Thermoanaerobaculia bacterium]